MKSIVLTLLLLSATNFAFGAAKKDLSKVDYEQLRWNQIHNLIMQEINTIVNVKRKSPKLMYRMFELKSELVKIYKEKDNKNFMALKLKHGKKIKRKAIFKKTISLYKGANKYGLNLLKRYPKTRYKAAIYYTLGLNSRDFAYDNKELVYLRKAIEYSKGQTKVNYLARTSLAEYYYNSKNWKGAIYQYELVINNQDDEWYTKNLLNYGWCLLKSQRFDNAIINLEKSFTLSMDEFYVDVREQAMVGLISFYVLGKQIQRGIDFLDLHAKGDHASMLKLARKASGKGFYPETQKIIDLLESRLSPKKHTELFADFTLFQFEFYQQYHKVAKLLEIAKRFTSVKFNKYQNEDAIRKIASVVGAQQVILKKDFSKHQQEYDEKVLTNIISYFDILAAIDHEEKPQYEYFKAETYYSVELFKDALSSYKISLVSYDKTPSKEDLRHKNLDAIFSCIDNIEFNKKDKRKNLEYAYLKYLSYWPKDKKAQEIHPRIYSLYTSVNNYPKMQSSLDNYISHFPKDLKKQQALYRLLLDSLIKKKKTELLANKITKMQKGYLVFTKTEVKKSETILANILFGQLQLLNKEGNSEAAIAGYQTIHFTDYYPKSIKGEAAFNMGMIYTDLENNSNALKWYQKSFNYFTPKEKNQKRPFLEKMALRTSLLHNFLNAAKLNKFILHNYCNQKVKNTPVFQSSIKNDLANDYVTKAMFTIKEYQKCSKSFPNELKKDIMSHLFEHKHYNTLYSIIDEYKLWSTYADEVSFYYERLYWQNFRNSKITSIQLRSKLKRLKHKNISLFFKAHKALDKFAKKVQRFGEVRIKINTKKPNPQKFIKKLTARINKIKSFSNQASDILSLGHGQVSVLVYDQLTKLSNNFQQEVLEYEIPIPDANFQKQFKGEMNKISRTMGTEAKSLRFKTQKLIEKYELLITSREESHLSKEILEISDIRVPASEMAITFGLGQ